MQSFVSARGEGNSRNETRWLHRVQLSQCRWSNSRQSCASGCHIMEGHDSRRPDGHLSVSPDAERL